MDFYFLAPDRALRLPVNPPEVEVQGEKDVETVNVINLGEVDFAAGDKRTGIRFASFFPRFYDASYCRYADIPNPEDAMGQLIAWRIAGKPVRLIVTETSINALVLIVQTAHRYVGGEPGDIYYDLALRQWREIKVRAVPPAGQKPREDTKPVPRVYVVKAGDSLWKIARLLLNDGSKWRQVYDANKQAIGPDPDKLKTGTKLVIPA